MNSRSILFGVLVLLVVLFAITGMAGATTFVDANFTGTTTVLNSIHVVHDLTVDGAYSGGTGTPGTTYIEGGQYNSNLGIQGNALVLAKTTTNSFRSNTSAIADSFVQAGSYGKFGGQLQGNSIYSNTTGRFDGAITGMSTEKIMGTSTLNRVIANSSIYAGTTAETKSWQRIGGQAKVNDLYSNTTGRFDGAITGMSTEKIMGTSTLNRVIANSSIYAGTTGEIKTTLKVGTIATVGNLVVNNTAAQSLATALTANTTLTASTMKAVNPLDPASGSTAVVVQLPDAATVTAGTTANFPTVGAPTAGKYVALTVGTGILGYTGAPGLRTADASASMTVYSDGSKWWPIYRVGTWAHYP